MAKKKTAIVTTFILSGMLVFSGIATASAANSATNSATPNLNTVLPNNNIQHLRPVHHMDGHINLQNEIAGILKMDVEQLRQELKSGKTLAQIASAKGTDTNVLTQKIQVMLNNNIDKAVSENKISSERAAQLKEKTSQRAQTLMNKTWLGHKKHRQKKETKRILFKGVGQEIQSILGMDANTLKTEFKNGKTLAQIAQEKQISQSDLTAKIQVLMETNINNALKEQKISAAKAEEIKAALPEKINAMLNHQHSEHK